MSNSKHLGLVLGLFAASVYASAADLAILRNGFSIRHEHRELVGAVTRLYTVADKSSFVDIPTVEIDHFEKDLAPPPLPPAPLTPAAQTSATNATQAGVAKNPQKLGELIDGISKQQSLDPDLVNSVIRAESGFNPRAVSPKGAQGLMQLMPQTASKLGVSNPFDPSANIDGGTRYLRELLERYNFDMVKALAAYNAGPQRVEQYRGVPPYYETRVYVAKIVRDYNRKKIAEQKALKAAARAQKAQKSPSKASQTATVSQPPTPSR